MNGSEKPTAPVALQPVAETVAMGLATNITLPLLKWWISKEYLFIALEGFRGVVPSALASLPLSLALKYH
ncbi:hypothetical protein QDY65_03505 [Pyrococcus kukulkanii]|uniref:hypothetical protein n=1 Tax=Pyrococcus kukulkanii TaxID=1609559 RepID=UPI0035662D31